MDHLEMFYHNIKSINYNSVKRTLQISFINGETYEHYNVPKIVYNELLKTCTPGYYIHCNIRNTYPYKKIS